ncbi:AraC family transcriptional regulator [Myxococcus stipitatus DSM 14675]|uniref:AraC family transcriptional regulator n=1 Tax=Myxococcus stipitatus (strain DSM 14675 / JCM 12634 / Mx s8) TaxID=1278073 RepID=L7U411_MYXSD|nr:helix-turn-helix domain-containing protein [Myxococcus stipitatus]AGC42908.1 AraC family transcriptional regulator [Myxococcus stipitatus DSM 14675]
MSPSLFTPSERTAPFVQSAQIFSPSGPLAPFVSSIIVAEGGPEMTRTLLPLSGIVLGIGFRGSATQIDERSEHVLPNALIQGMGSLARRIRGSANGGSVLVTFSEVGAAQFFKGPLHELFNAFQPLDDLVPRAEVDRLSARLAEAGTLEARAALVEQFLSLRLSAKAPDPMVVAAVRAIRMAQGSLRMGALARSLHISQDALEKRFRRIVGTTPKHFASILRLRQVIDAYHPGASLSDLSLDAGYFDQSHFHREFRHVTGDAPRRFFASEDYF